MLLATRLNRAMKREQKEWQSLCQLFLSIGIVIVATNFVAMLTDSETCWVGGLKIWGCFVMGASALRIFAIERDRINVGNKFKNVLIFQYLCKQSKSNEISDEAADTYNQLSTEERKKIERKLNNQLLLSFLIAATIILMIQ